MNPFADPAKLTIQFSHVSYQLAQTFAARATGIPHYQTWTREDTRARLAEADVLVISAFWNNALLEAAPRLRFIQGVGAGYDQYPLDELRRRGILLASARGVNRKAVSEHAMGMILSLSRLLHTTRDHQSKSMWRPMIADRAQREDELPGKTLLIVGLGTIGSRLAELARAFGMHVIGVKRDIRNASSAANEVHALAKLDELLPRADYVALTCPLTPETTDLINARTLGRMKPTAFLINVARGGCVDETALLAALRSGAIAGAGLDTFKTEPLPADSPFWGFENVIITPHTAGETRHYEDNVIDILIDNLGRLARGEKALRNQIV